MTSVLMLLGEADDIASPALCNTVTKGVPAEKLKVITYPNARQGFDMRGLPETRLSGRPREVAYLGPLPVMLAPSCQTVISPPSLTSPDVPSAPLPAGPTRYAYSPGRSP